MKMKISEIQEKINNCSDYIWINPSNIDGFNAVEELKRKVKIFNEGGEDVDDSPTSVVEEYLSGCIIDGEIDGELPATPMEILDAAFYLITQAGSSEVAFSWPAFRRLFPDDQAEVIMNCMQSSYDKVENCFVKYLLLEFILDFYMYGPMWVSFEESDDAYKEISNDSNHLDAFKAYIKSVGDSKNIGSLFHQGKMTDSFMIFLKKLYDERPVFQKSLRNI